MTSKLGGQYNFVVLKMEFDLTFVQFLKYIYRKVRYFIENLSHISQIRGWGGVGFVFKKKGVGEEATLGHTLLIASPPSTVYNFFYQLWRIFFCCMLLISYAI